MQRIGLQAWPAGVTVQQLRSEVAQLQSSCHQLSLGSGTLGQAVKETSDRLRLVERTVEEQSRDLAAVAENVGSCLAAAREEATPASYLSSLLAPVASSYLPPPKLKSAWVRL